jgi:serine/threonine protein kinase
MNILNTSIKDYYIKSELGQGGMATVYLAHDNKFDTEVAIKLLRKEFVLNENIRKRFIAEARKMFKMSHPNIIKVTDLIEDGDRVAFVMEYVEGETLKEYIDRKGKLKDEEIKHLFTQMLDAVGYVHEQKLVHRDIKPSNFMVNQEGKVKLMDFGIAKTLDASSAEYTQTGTGMQLGTPMYMSPEQITETKSVTAQSDIYSLGVVLWQMVTGQKPYDTNTLSNFQLQTKIVNEKLEITNSKWDIIIQKAAAKVVLNRYNNCLELIQTLNNPPNKDDLIDEDKTILSDNIDKIELESNLKEKKALVAKKKKVGAAKPKQLIQKKVAYSNTGQTRESEGNSKPTLKNQSKIKANKKKYTWLFWPVGIFLFFGSFVLYDYLTYPQNEYVLRGIYCDKYWEMESFNIDELYINDTLIQKPSSDIRKSIINLVEPDSKSELYSVLQQMANDTYKYDNLMITHYNSNLNKYISFDVYYDINKSEYAYTTSLLNLEKIDSRFVFVEEESFTNLLVSGDNEEDDGAISKSTIEIVSVSADELQVKQDITLIDENESKIRLVVNNVYKPTTPKPKFLSRIEEFKLQWDLEWPLEWAWHPLIAE